MKLLVFFSLLSCFLYPSLHHHHHLLLLFVSVVSKRNLRKKTNIHRRLIASRHICMLSHRHHQVHQQYCNKNHSHSENIIHNGKIVNIWKYCLFNSRTYTITIDQILRLSLDLIHAIYIYTEIRSIDSYYFQDYLATIRCQNRSFRS